METTTKIFGPSISPGITRRRWIEKHINFANHIIDLVKNNEYKVSDPHLWEVWRMHLETFLEYGSEEELDKSFYKWDR